MPHPHEQEIPSYIEKKAVQVRDSNPSDSARMSVEVPTSGSLIKFAAKKNSLISQESYKAETSVVKSKEPVARSASGLNEQHMNSHEKFNCISEMIEAGALRTQASGYNLEFKSKFAQKSPLVHRGT